MSIPQDMQTGFARGWLTAVSLSAAIAVPTSSILGISPPAWAEDPWQSSDVGSQAISTAADRPATGRLGAEELSRPLTDAAAAETSSFETGDRAAGNLSGPTVVNLVSPAAAEVPGEASRDTTTAQAAEDTPPDALDRLSPAPNPLLLPTQPEDVEVMTSQPITLEQAIELAYRNNPDLRVALLELEQSRAALREARADLWPTLSVNGQLEGRNVTDSSFDPTSFSTETTEELGGAVSGQIDLSYSLYSSGGRAASIRAAEEQVRLSELEVERRLEELRLNTINEYYDLQQTIEQIRIEEAFLEEAERNLEDTRLREEAGVGTRFDVLRAEVQAANARQQLVQARSDRRVAQRQLARRLNLPPDTTITTVPVEVAGNWPLTLEESIVQAYQNRAELEQQLVQREISEQQRRIALSELGPQVDLFANYNAQDLFTRDNDSFNDNYSFGARVSWTIFEGGAAAARAEQQAIEGDIAARNFEDTRSGIRLEVEQAFFNLQSNQENIQTARLAVEQAEEALRLANLRFDAGVGTQLDVLQAQSDLTDAEASLVNAILGYNRSLAALKRAVSNLTAQGERNLPY